MPAYLAGRDTQIEEARTILTSLVSGYPQQSIIYTGLRGVGKTVLLNKVEEIADQLGIYCEHLEIKEKSNFAAQIATISYRLITKLSMFGNAKDFANKFWAAFKHFTLTYTPPGNTPGNESGTFTFELPDSDINFQVPSNFPDDLTEIFLELGKIAASAKKTICFFIDEVQYLGKEDLEGLANAIHRINQKRLPIVVFAAGLPKILKDFGDAKSYSERLFKFVSIDSLNSESARLAITEPATAFQVTYTSDAIEKILQITGCYPYFIQEYCNIIWSNVDNTTTITIDDVLSSESDFYHRLDQSFFRVRYNRCSERELDFIYAMVRCGELPCTISNVAKQLNTASSSISPIRGNLIRKGIIYSSHYGEIDFTVPHFDAYLKRVDPSLRK